MQTLRLMEKPPDTRLTPDVAREVCQRANATTEIEGSIAALGRQYVIGLNAVNCSSGETLAEEQVTADGKEKVLAALGDAAFQLRAKLGESHESMQTYSMPLEQATTSSLEALQAYTQGNQYLVKDDVAGGNQLFAASRGSGSEFRCRVVSAEHRGNSSRQWRFGRAGREDRL